ncbi:MAG: acetolactate synthase large subunit [Chloroflexi bacterium]|nr:acetolactate synthase large subunit [Chloroflexota bacterium]
MKASDLLVRCLEQEGVQYVFGLPGEETLDVMDSLSRSPIRFILTRHEAGAAFMATVWGRLTGRPGVCLSTLGPGATNLLTGVATAYLDHAPVVAITAQAAMDRAHKESHQYVDIRGIFRPVTKWGARVESSEVIPEMVRTAFKLAEVEHPGPSHIELPEGLPDSARPRFPPPSGAFRYPRPDPEAIQRAAQLVAASRRPVIVAGHGVIRRHASAQLTALAAKGGIPVVETFQGKGSLDNRHPLSLLSIGLLWRDRVMDVLEAADLVLAAGYDLVEYPPYRWNPTGDKPIVHIGTMPAEVDEYFSPREEIVADLAPALGALAEAIPSRPPWDFVSLRAAIMGELEAAAEDSGFPVKPQRLVSDLRHALDDDAILVSDVGAHKLWLGRMYPAFQPENIIISNGLASMGIGLPGALAARLAYPKRQVVAVVGDGGLLMTAQEMETARREGINVVCVVWVDGTYGAVDWKAKLKFGQAFGVGFTNPDFVRFARSFGWEGYNIERAQDFLPTLQHALGANMPSLIAVPVDYGENLALTRRLQKANV